MFEIICLSFLTIFYGFATTIFSMQLIKGVIGKDKYEIFAQIFLIAICGVSCIALLWEVLQSI